MFLNNRSRYHYNSFVFGSSRTLAFRPGSWARYLPSGSSPYMFDANIESVYGIYTKLRFLDSLQVHIDNALIILCTDASFMFDANNDGHLFIKDPKTSGESELAFQLTFYKAYLNSNFLVSYYRYLITKKVTASMSKYLEYRRISYDTITNEIRILDQEEEISKNITAYYKARKKIFYPQAGEHIDTSRQIDSRRLFMLGEIKRILEKNHTSYKVVISPLYDQLKFNEADFTILKSLFENHLYDFSGSNYFTNDKHNYYEASHYRPIVGDSILHKIYE